MKYIRYLCLSLMLSIFLLSVPVRVLALNVGLEIDLFSNDEAKRTEDFLAIELLLEEPPKKPLSCFAVNSNHMIAIGHSEWLKHIVCVYNASGEFQYGYRFNSDGGSFYVDWDEENVVVYLLRCDEAIEMDANGKVLNVAEVLDTADNSDYRYEHLIPNKKTVGDIQYYGKNEGLSPISSDYAMLVAKDPYGKEIVIYDASAEKRSIGIYYAIGTMAFFGVAIVFSLRNMHKKGNTK